ncbi:DUF2510 domain-containing protein [Rhodococcus pseudokoreensis]|uniref:DUF2510 domain-containing protein n=1 Tax=Rhodococcus pseudokoreensis TaxID=2811421 RepID=A0A974ZY09_9NOCA|nr:DUF2510 domain-containing protein [Rhodococcus pseudokoreensis]QSE94211.1 DUF2510 domain-containing protein [Rhodococcus pseudokoreensis]
MTTPTPPPGWYPDPQNPAIIRYWDGVRWTANAHPNSLTTQPAVPPAPKRKYAWLLYAAVALILIVAVTGFFDPSSSTSKPAANYPTLDASKDPTLLDPSTYEEINERDFAVILKNPWDHIGRRVILHGTVWQFDTATGSDHFLAEVGTSPTRLMNNERAYIDGRASVLAPFVEGDEVTMHVVVDGQKTYTSTEEKEITVPQFQVAMIELTK